MLSRIQSGNHYLRMGGTAARLWVPSVAFGKRSAGICRSLTIHRQIVHRFRGGQHRRKFVPPQLCFILTRRTDHCAEPTAIRAILSREYL